MFTGGTLITKHHEAQNHMRSTLIAATLLILLPGCTSTTVEKVDSTVKLSHVCIENNPKVIVGGFLATVENGFRRNGITTEIYKDNPPEYCQHRLTYTALQKWDVVTYLRHAELWLYQGKEQIGYVEFHMNGGGGMALTKYASVESKLNPLIDELLAGYSPELVDTYRKDIPHADTETLEDKQETLKILKTWLEEGLIGEEEYQAEKQRILSEL